MAVINGDEAQSTSTLSPAPGIDLADYKQTLIRRFANPEVRDTLARLYADTSDRIPKWLLPVIQHQLCTGGDIRRSALVVVAAWARFAEGLDEQGAPIRLVDRLAEPLTAAARRQRDDPTAFIANRDVFGDLVEDARFVTAYTAALHSLHTRGALATVRELQEND